MESIKKFYNSREANFGFCGDRRDKILPLAEKFHHARILDVGCWTGFVGAKLKKKSNYVVGWDISGKAVSQAKQILDKAIVVDLESNNWPRVEKFDLILCTEVLEHLFTPEKVLVKLKNYLAPDGRILLSTPNILHIYRRIQFLFGKFEYRDDSIINRSHLHFFTRDSFIETVERLGLEVVEENDVVFPRTGAFIWKIWPNLFANQTVILVRTKNSKSHEE